MVMLIFNAACDVTKKQLSPCVYVTNTTQIGQPYSTNLAIILNTGEVLTREFYPARCADEQSKRKKG